MNSSNYSRQTSSYMALTLNHRHYTNTSPTISTHPNYSLHSANDLLLPCPSKSSTIDMMSSSKYSWHDLISESSNKSIKDEIFDFDITEIPSLQANDIDYTIINSENPQSIKKISLNKSKIKTKKSQSIPHMLMMSASGNSLTEFDRRSNSSSTIKQQPFSPPPYHPLTNGFFNHHHHHHHLQRSTPSPDNEQISPTSNNNRAETSSTSTLVPPPATGGGPVSPEDKRRCAVCNDIASGYHYGVWSCEGCKAFFKRSIQGTNEYICPATNTCTIDKHRRKSCQACRLRRCYEVGMTKGTTRRERKYRKKAVSVCKITSTSSNPNNNNNSIGNNQEHGLLISNNITPPTTTGTPSSQINNNNNNPFSSSSLQINRTTSDSTRIPITSAEFIATLSQASRLNLPAKADTSRPLDDQYFLQLLAKIFDQELVVLINWAKAMPGYTESLTLDQQVTIIEQSWLDTLLLDIIERSLERNDDTLHFAPDFIISRNRDLSSPGLGTICTNLFHILQSFKDPRTTHEEFIALKATILINSIPATLTTTKSFRLLTNQVYQAIQYTCDSNPSVYHDNYIRHFTLLLQLPHLKMLSSKLIRLFLNMRANDLLPQADLLLEMLDAQDTFDITNSFLTINNDLTTKNDNKTQNTDELNNQMNYRASSSSPMTYSTATNGKRSSTSPTLQFYKHSRTESIPTSPSTNMHFPMNNSTY